MYRDDKLNAKKKRKTFTTKYMKTNIKSASSTRDIYITQGCDRKKRGGDKVLLIWRVEVMTLMVIIGKVN